MRHQTCLSVSFRLTGQCGVWSGFHAGTDGNAFLNANRVAELWCIPQGNGPVMLLSVKSHCQERQAKTARCDLHCRSATGGICRSRCNGTALADLLVARIKGQPDLPVTQKFAQTAGMMTPMQMWF